MTRLLARLVVLAVAGPVFVLVPTVSRPIAEPRPVPPRVQKIPLQAPARSTGTVAEDGTSMRSGAVETDRFRLLGVTWQGQSDVGPPRVRVRVRSAGQWSGWVALDTMDAGPDAGTLDASRQRGSATEPLWTRAADAVDVALEAESGSVPRDAELVLVDPGASPADQALGRAGVLGGEGSTATAYAGQPYVIPRSAWGADEGLRLGQCSEGPAYGQAVKVGFVHHTATSNDYGPAESAAIIRSIYAFHVHGRGWCDIAYNFLVDHSGQIFEGRYGGPSLPVIGGHTGGFNTDAFGVAMIGDFESRAPSAAMSASVEGLLAWKLAESFQHPHGTAQLASRCVETCRYPAGSVVTFNAVSGHRDASLTGCPGSRAYGQLPLLRNGAAARTGLPSVPPGDLGEPLGGYTIGSPSGVWWSPGRYQLFAAGGDARLWHRGWTAGVGWSPWQPIGGQLTSAPSASSREPGRIDVVARGLDGAAWRLSYDGSGWSGWEPLGGYLIGGPAGVSWGPGHYDVYAAGRDSRLWHRRWTATSGWAGWEPLGGILTSGPSVSSWGPGRIDVVARGLDGAAWHSFYDGGRWWGWESLGGYILGSPTGVSWAPGRYDVFAAGGDRGLWHQFSDSISWSGWLPRGGWLTSGPTAATFGPGRLDVVARSGDGSVRHRWYESGWWFAG